MIETVKDVTIISEEANPELADKRQTQKRWRRRAITAHGKPKQPVDITEIYNYNPLKELQAKANHQLASTTRKSTLSGYSRLSDPRILTATGTNDNVNVKRVFTAKSVLSKKSNLT